jgi:hypothetical protein
MSNLYSIKALPTIPDKFLLCIQDIEKFEPLFADFGHLGYATYSASTELKDFLQPFFHNPITCTYQVIKKNLAPHRDVCKQQNKYNYIYSGNTNVITSWLADDTVIQSVCCEFHTWYELNVSVNHQVQEVILPRISVVVKEKTG